MPPKGRTLYDPDNKLVRAFVEASEKTKTPAELRELARRRPLLELTSPGLLRVLDMVAGRSSYSARRVGRLRRDLKYVYDEAKRAGILP